MRVVSFLLAAATVASAQGIFADGVVHDIRLHMHPSDWTSLRANYLENTFYAAEFEWQGTRIPEVAVRSRGLGSRNDVKPGLLVSFDRYVPGRRELGVNALVLDNSTQDPSFLRERLSMMLFARAGLPAPRESYARVFVNEELVGLYIVVEDIGPSFLERVFGSGEGALYEYKWLFDWRYQSLGDDLTQYLPLFEPRNDTRNRNRQELVELVRTINSPADSGYAARIAEVIELPEYLRLLAVEHYLADWDGQAGLEGINNFYLFRHGNPARFSYIPWDKDVTLSRMNVSVLAIADDFVLLRGLFSDPAILREYASLLAETAVLAGGADGYLEAEARRLLALITPAVLEDRNKPTSDEAFAENAEAVLRFVRERVTVIAREANTTGMR